MKTFISDIIPKIQRFSQKLDNLTLLNNQHWVFIEDSSANKIVYIFRDSNQLLISTNGKVEKARWEYLGNKSLLIDKEKDSYIFKHGFFDENILALKVDSSDEYFVFVNETRYNQELNTINDIIRFLNDKYLRYTSSDESIGMQPRQYLTSKKLPGPNLYVVQMLMGNSQNLIESTLNWEQFCSSHSIYYPLYTYQELLKRGVLIGVELKSGLNDYAKWRGFISFEDMKNDYFF